MWNIFNRSTLYWGEFQSCVTKIILWYILVTNNRWKKNSQCLYHKTLFFFLSFNSFRDTRKNLVKCFYFFNKDFFAIWLLLSFYFFVNFTVLYDTYFTIERIDFTTYIFVGGKTFEITLLTPRNQIKKCTETGLRAVILREEEVFPVQRAIFIFVSITIRC